MTVRVKSQPEIAITCVCDKRVYLICSKIIGQVNRGCGEILPVFQKNAISCKLVAAILVILSCARAGKCGVQVKQVDIQIIRIVVPVLDVMDRQCYGGDGFVCRDGPVYAPRIIIVVIQIAQVSVTGLKESGMRKLSDAER